ncbi:TetR/AcrR family transcriptional regulator [Nocardia bhagyanarayanae]|uniref:TetR family transcriptional regulator n=1 Tax=Nocardia bhagyanarayanae TaxID=1215925 RepID=A0A543EW38_9NOCA|nr:TetR/AcrR family transcriptional regulator [Nocardia bhagyanarayanae]TQM25759.1 TetR family transcriptional regulator [Nocardia bhagyanarayanae]
MPRAGKRIKGTADERAEARERLRAELLSAARSIARESGGFDGVTVRSVADRVGYAVPIVYQYFANKRALLVELMEAGFTDLAERLHGALDAPVQDDPLLEVAWAYWDFAVADPHLYRLMHTLPEVPFGTADAPEAARSCFEALRSAVAAGAPKLPEAVMDDDAAADLLWAHLHGLVGLMLDGRIKGGAERGRALLVDLTSLFRATP